MVNQQGNTILNTLLSNIEINTKFEESLKEIDDDQIKNILDMSQTIGSINKTVDYQCEVKDVD